jgi:Alpha 1,4-glycosyltransferase conserved region
MAEEICGLWIGERLGTIERLCIQSFLDHGHPFRLFTYGDLAGVPEGTTIENGHGVLSESLMQPFQSPGASIAHFADWFRWKLLEARGGFWVDMDVVCLREFDFSAPVVYGKQDPHTPSIGVLKFPAQHPLTTVMVDRCESPHRFRPEDSWRRKVRKTWRRLRGGSRADLEWGEAGGPDGFTVELAGSEYEHFGLPYTVFYPVHHQHWSLIFDETFKNDPPEFFADTRAIHLWGEILRRYSPTGPDDAYPPGSLFEQLKRRHLAEG